MSGLAPRVLLVKLSSLGDVVHAMPALQDLRRARPEVLIDWVVEPAFAPLVQRCKGVNRVIPCALRRWRKNPLAPSTRQEWSAFRAQLQAFPFDAVIDLQGLTKSALVAWLAPTASGGKKFALAHQTDGSGYEAPTRWVADTAIAMPPHIHAVERSRQLCAQAMGYSVAGPAVFGLAGRESKRAVNEALVGESLASEVPVGATSVGATSVSAMPVGKEHARAQVVLVHGTSRADKEWPLAHWVALGQRLNAQGFQVVLAHGSAAELHTSQTIAASLADAKTWPSMPLDTLVDTMARCQGVIGVDSGLSHIAVALDLPHVQIYNFDTAWRTGVQAPHQACVFAKPCPSVDAVWQAWMRVLA